MIICRTPFRISFFGGGTDYPAWYLRHGGQVLSTTIDKYCYLSLRHLPPFFEHRYRIVYSRMENVKSIEEIAHPVVRETLRHLNFETGLEIHHDGDLPARSGVGSSSSFTVGLLHALNTISQRSCDQMNLALGAMHIERELVKDTVGSQDQVAVAFGGLNKIVFHPGGGIEIKPITQDIDRIRELNENLMLFFTGILRNSSEVARQYVGDLEKKDEILRKMHSMVDQAMKILDGNEELSTFGDLLHRNWLLKKSLSEKISNQYIDDIYERALQAGALGGKLTGAGGGGFLLLYVPKKARSSVRKALHDLLHVPFRFEFKGSRIIFHDSNVNDLKHAGDNRQNRIINGFKQFYQL